MKFIHYLESITGISIYPLLSLLIFFTFFSFLVFYVIKSDKQHIRKLAHLPLEGEETDNTKTN